MKQLEQNTKCRSGKMPKWQNTKSDGWEKTSQVFFILRHQCDATVTPLRWHCDANVTPLRWPGDATTATGTSASRAQNILCLSGQTLVETCSSQKKISDSVVSNERKTANVKNQRHQKKFKFVSQNVAASGSVVILHEWRGYETFSFFLKTQQCDLYHFRFCSFSFPST